MTFQKVKNEKVDKLLNLKTKETNFVFKQHRHWSKSNNKFLNITDTGEKILSSGKKKALQENRNAFLFFMPHSLECLLC